MSYRILKASQEDAQCLHELGVAVYHSTYSEILAADQIAFMLAKNYSPQALLQTMQAGQDFYLLIDPTGQAAGFIALQEKDQHTLRIEKLYLLAAQQGKGQGRALLQFAMQTAKEQSYKKLELNVNRGNKAYYFYLKQGFQVVQEIDIPYYGYILDDYIMQKLVG